MKYITPEYYNEFHCIADQCPDTCCAGWEITIDHNSMQQYQSMKGPLGNRLHNSIDWKQHTFLQYDHKCIFLNEDKLCDLYTEAGPDSLCQTCKQYPRHTESYLNVRELSIAISCPEMARMLLTRKDKVVFETREVKKREEVDVIFPMELFHQLNDARQLIFDLLQDRTLETKIRMGLVLGLAHDLQKRIVGRDYESMARLISHYKKKDIQQHLVKKLDYANSFFGNSKTNKVMSRHSKLVSGHGRKALMYHVWKELLHLEALNKPWPVELRKAQITLNQFTTEQYGKLYKIFRTTYPDLEIQMEQLMVYFIYGYSNGAVYDGEFYGKVKFAVFHTMALEELFFAAWIKEKYHLSLNQQITIAHQYAREIEHLDQNIEHIETVLCKNKAFRLSNMIKALS